MQYLSKKEAHDLGCLILNDIANASAEQLDPNTQTETTIVHTAHDVFDDELMMTLYVVTENDANPPQKHYREIDGAYLDLDMLQQGRVFFEDTPENVKISIFKYFNTSSLKEILDLTKKHNNPREKIGKLND